MTRDELKLWAEFHANPLRSNLRNKQAKQVLIWIERGTPRDLRFAEVTMDQANWFRPPGVPSRSVEHARKIGEENV